MNYADAHAAASAKHDPTVAANMDAYWAELKRLEALPVEPAASTAAEAPERHWSGWVSETSTGRLAHSNQHRLDGPNGLPVCGARPSLPNVGWAGDDTAPRCKRCCRVTA
jgi:hypothetical protein